MIACFSRLEKTAGTPPGPSLRTRFLAVTALALLFAACLAGWPVDVLVVKDGEDAYVWYIAGTAALTASTGSGGQIATRYIHSVEKSPVEDWYALLNGRIWGWREKVRTHNAGLPFGAPRQGRFYHDPPWMVVEGGRQSWDRLFVRIGNEELGRNEILTPGGAWFPLYRDFSGKRLTFLVERRPFLPAFFSSDGCFSP